jgi:hypothetical protein
MGMVMVFRARATAAAVSTGAGNCRAVAAHAAGPGGAEPEWRAFPD